MIVLVLGFIGYAAVGRILIFLWQRFPEKYVPTKFVKDVHACDLCSGVYIYTAVAWVAGASLMLGAIIGCVTSFVVWIFMKGVKAAFAPDIIHL